MEYNPDIWFSPRNVLYHYARRERELGEDFINNPDYKQMREARSVAFMLLGIMKELQTEYWLQLVNPREETPDIKTATMVRTAGKLNWLDVQEVELVTLNIHSNEEVDDFIKRTKLPITKSYPKTTTILCHIDKTINTKPWGDISKVLSSVKTQNDVFLMGRVSPEKHIYQLVKIHPKIDILVTFDALEEASSPGLKGVMRFKSSTVMEYREGKTYIPF